MKTGQRLDDRLECRSVVSENGTARAEDAHPPLPRVYAS